MHCTGCCGTQTGVHTVCVWTAFLGEQTVNDTVFVGVTVTSSSGVPCSGTFRATETLPVAGPLAFPLKRPVAEVPVGIVTCVSGNATSTFVPAGMVTSTVAGYATSSSVPTGMVTGTVAGAFALMIVPRGTVTLNGAGGGATLRGAFAGVVILKLVGASTHRS